MWSQRELFDGTYTFRDLLDMHEFLDIREENTRRQQEWAKRQSEVKPNA